MTVTDTYAYDELDPLVLHTLAETADALDIEVWKVHPEWTHLAVSTNGRVRNCNTGNLVGYQSGPRGGERAPNPYLRARVSDIPGRKTAAVSVLVLETFVGPRPDGHEADHENHNSLDNRLVNLRWIPAPENQARRASRRT